MTALIFTVQVDYTDRTRTAAGTFTTFSTVVDVLADTDTDATLAAAQMVGAIRDDAIDGMVTATRIVSCVA
jgi:hypothetical protein